jgi:putative tricarboxylic transport membrane protein
VAATSDRLGEALGQGRPNGDRPAEAPPAINKSSPWKERPLHDEPSPSASGRAAPGRVRSPRDLAAGASLVALALFALWAGAPLDTGARRAMGPGMLPRYVAIAVLAAGLLLCVLSLLKSGEGLGRWPLRGPVFVSLAVLAFALTIRSVGLAVAGPLVVIVSGAASPESRPRELVIFALIITAFCIGLFKYALGLPIPVLLIPDVVTL